jgi:hypothetical protein
MVTKVKGAMNTALKNYQDVVTVSFVYSMTSSIKFQFRMSVKNVNSIQILITTR